jgi:hypothetical protein
MDRRTKTCILIIFAGLANFLAYTLLYVYLYGEAVNGWVLPIEGQTRYFLQSGREVSRAAYIYSGIHSISIWPTAAAIMLAMLTLAKDRVVSAMRSSALRGRTLLTIMATLITMIAAIMTVWFVLQFTSRLAGNGPPPPDGLVPAGARP